MKKTALALGLSAALLAGFANAHQQGDVIVRANWCSCGYSHEHK